MTEELKCMERRERLVVVIGGLVESKSKGQSKGMSRSKSTSEKDNESESE